MNFTRDIIFELASSLRARLLMNILAACTGLSLENALDLTHLILNNQVHYTALDWIVSTHRAVQLRLPERCASLAPDERKPR